VQGRGSIGLASEGRGQIRVQRFQLAAEERARVIRLGLRTVDPAAQGIDVRALQVAAVRIDRGRTTVVNLAPDPTPDVAEKIEGGLGGSAVDRFLRDQTQHASGAEEL
jgi:hypothetical protein